MTSTIANILATIAAALYLLYRGGRAIEWVRRLFSDRAINGAESAAATAEKGAENAAKKSANSVDDYNKSKSEYDSSK